MADTQHGALSTLVLSGEIVPYIESRITVDFFTDPKHAQVWELVQEHYRKYGKVPSPEAVQRAYPNYTFPEFPEPPSYYLGQLQQDRKKVLLTEAVQEYANLLNDEDDPGPDVGDRLEQILRSGLANAAHEISRGRDTDFFLSRDRLMDRIHERMADPGYLRGVPTGFDGIDRVTGGYQPEQLITFVGLPKAGKSSTLLASALHVRRSGYPVLFLTFEMSTEEQEDRLLSLISGVSLSKILNGTLTSSEATQIDKALAMRSGLSGFTITSDISSTTTVSGVQAKIRQYDPAVAFVDGVYLMDDERGQEKGSSFALTNITRDLKRLAQVTRKCVVAGTQALASKSKGGLSTASIGYTSSFAQDSDVILGLERDPEIDRLATLSVLDSRSGPRAKVFMDFNWDRGVVAEMGQDEYELAKAMPKGAKSSLWEEEEDAA